MSFAQLRTGISMYYEELGSGDPLVFISGQNTDHTQWDTVRNQYADTYRVITFDHRGTGQTDKPESPYSTRGFAADVIALLDELGIERAHFFGISMGGRVGQWVAIDYPGRVASMVLAATTPGAQHGVVRDKAATTALLGRAAKGATSDPLIPYLVSSHWADEHPEFVQTVTERRRNVGGTHARQLHFAASENHDSWDALPSISVPVLVLHGDDDRLNPTANAQRLTERIPGAQLHLIAGGRHEFFVEFPEETAQVVHQFLTEHALQPPMSPLL